MQEINQCQQLYVPQPGMRNYHKGVSMVRSLCTSLQHILQC